MRRMKPDPSVVVRTLRVRLKDKHTAVLREAARQVNFVWNYCNELSLRITQREHRFAGENELKSYTAGATKQGLERLQSHTVQAVCEEYATRRKQFKKLRLRWRVSGGTRRSLGWIPFKESAVQYRSGQLHISKLPPLSLWDSYGLSQYHITGGTLSEDSRGRWYANLTVRIRKPEVAPPDLDRDAALGIDLGLKDLAAYSEESLANLEAPQFYRRYEAALATAQRANKTQRVRAIHAKIANARKDCLHKETTRLTRGYRFLFIGNVSAPKLAQTPMAKSVYDVSWGTLRNMALYKGDYAGAIVRVVNERYSTRECSACGERTGPAGLAGLAVREWTCPCGAVHNRDRNSAKVIRQRGLLAYAMELVNRSGSASPERMRPRDAAAAGHGRPVGGIPGV